MAKLTLSTGSNQDDRLEFLTEGRRQLTTAFGEPHYVSPIVESPAWGNTDQGDFLNQVLVFSVAARLVGKEIQAELHRLLDLTQAIEERLGRRREVHWGPRTLDIDLIFIDDIVYEDERISLPHPWWHQRPFVRDLLPPDFRSGRRYFQ